MPIRDLMLAVLVVAIWGFNFVVIKWGLHELSPLSLAAYRFLFVCFPAIFFLKRPKVPSGLLLAFGLTQSFGQFAFMFSAIALGMPAGLTSVVLQCQALFTLGISSLFLGERFTRAQLFGVLVGILGLLLIASPVFSQDSANMTLPGLVCTILAALCWAIGNVLLRKIAKGERTLNMLSVVVWASLPLPLLFAVGSVIQSGSYDDFLRFAEFDIKTYLCIFYLSVFSTMIGYGLWNHLIQKYSAVKVAPFSILVPFFGLSSAFIFLSEIPHKIQLVGSVVLILSLSINMLGDRAKK